MHANRRDSVPIFDRDQITPMHAALSGPVLECG
jgi:hypothetical protein